MTEAFTAFLHAKRIHAQAWQQSRPDEFLALEQAFLLMGKASFDARKKFIFNELRKEFLWKEETASFERQAASGETAREDGASDKVQGASEEQPEVKKAPPMKLKIPLKKAGEGAGDKGQDSVDAVVGNDKEESNTQKAPSEEQPQPEVKKAPPMKLKIPLKKAEDQTNTPPTV